MRDSEDGGTGNASVSTTMFKGIFSIRLRLLISYFFLVQAVGHADPIWKDHLKTAGKTGYFETEYKEFVRAHLLDYVKLIYDEVSVTGELIVKSYDPKDYHYVFIGAGPLPIAVYLKNHEGVTGTSLPLSGFADTVWSGEFWILNPTGKKLSLPTEEYLRLLAEHFSRFLPVSALLGKKKILLIDTAETGTTIKNALKRIRDHFKIAQPNLEVKALALARSEFSAMKLKSMGHASLSAVVLPSQLGNLIADRVFQGLTEYTRFEPGREHSSEVRKIPAYDQFEKAMKQVMSEKSLATINPPTCSQPLEKL